MYRYYNQDMINEYLFYISTFGFADRDSFGMLALRKLKRGTFQHSHTINYS